MNDGTSWRYYQDGVEIDDALGTPVVPPMGDIGIGNNQPGGDEQFPGEIDNLRIFTVPRTPQQICQAAGSC